MGNKEMAVWNWQLTEFEREALTAIERLASHLCHLSEKVDQIMSTLQDILDELAVETTDIGKLTVIITNLEGQVSGVPGLTPAQQTQIDTIFADVKANTDSIVKAMGPVSPVVPGTTFVPPVVTQSPVPPVSPIVLPPIVAPGQPAPLVAPAFTGAPPPAAVPSAK
jgi:hypothetical protein